MRRALAFFFLCLFILAAPAALAYAQGYRFDFSTRKLRQTGVIVVQGQPKNVLLRLDGKKEYATTLPYTYRSILEGQHTVEVIAPGYSTQVLQPRVRAGQATYLPPVQLLQSQPFITLHTGLPSNALLAPHGLAVAWQAKGSAHITNEEKTVQSPNVQNLATSVWRTNDVALLDAEKKVLGTLDRDGNYSIGETPIPPKDQIPTTLVKNARITLDYAQRVDSLRSWFVTNAEGAWLLGDSGDSTLVTRWSEPPIGARMLSDSMLAIIRPHAITLRNLGTNHTETFALPGITAVAENPTEGVLHLLVQDADLRSWVRASFF